MKVKPALFILCFLISGLLTRLGYAQETLSNPSKTITSKEAKLLIDSLTHALEQYYVFPDKAAIMISYIKDQWKQGAYKNIKDAELLAVQLNKDLQKAHQDGHMWLSYNPKLARELKVQRSPQETEEDEKERIAAQRENSFYFRRIEILPGNIGYIRFDGFAEHTEEAKPMITAAFQFLSGTNALIIDLRTNRGGYPEMVSLIESYFFAEKTRMNDIIDRIGDQTVNFYADPAQTGGLTLSKPVYVLTSKTTFSAAEDFSYGMQNVKRAVIVGDTTRGGAHPTRPFPIGQNFVAGIPFARSYNPYTKTNWEGTGVIPDVPVAADLSLQKAQEIILSELNREKAE